MSGCSGTSRADGSSGLGIGAAALGFGGLAGGGRRDGLAGGVGFGDPACGDGLAQGGIVDSGKPGAGGDGAPFVYAENHSFIYSDGSRRMAPLYDQVCTLAWPELSKALSMKIGSAGSLEEVSPEHCKQLCAEAKLGWPMVRERLANLCTKIVDAIREAEMRTQDVTADCPARPLVLSRAERMLRLIQANF